MSTPPSIRKPRRLLKYCVIVVILLSIVVGAGFWVWTDQALSLPDASEVVSMKALLYGESADWQPIPEFDVPQEHISPILAGCRPHRRDWSPLKWQVLGKLTVARKDGRVFTIDLYKTSADPGAFSVHRVDRSRNYGIISNYFRGGTTDGILRSVQNAHAAVQKRGDPME